VSVTSAGYAAAAVQIGCYLAWSRTYRS